MKKIFKKLNRKQEPIVPARITTDTVAEHREQILAGGRRFKYPIQYSRHKLVINAVIISIVALILIVIFGWWRLYIVQDTGEFMYRVTKIISVPVAKVDGKAVPYSDYLMAFRSSAYYSHQKEQLNQKADDGKAKVDYFKKESMSGAIANTFAAKLAKELTVIVSDKELDDLLLQQRRSSNGESTQESFNAVILDYYGWSPSEYRHAVYSGLLRQKVAYALDGPALSAANGLIEAINSDNEINFNALTTNISDKFNINAIYGSSGWVQKFNQDGGLSVVAEKLEKGQTSGLVKPSKGDGYYVLRLLDKNDTQISYEYINIPLTVFDSRLEEVKKGDKLKIHITI